MDVIDNFNGSSGNLSWDGQSLEERSLLRTQTGVLGWDDDIVGSDGASSSRSSNLVGKDGITGFDEISISEYQTNISSDVREEFLQIWVVFQVAGDGSLHHRVLAHQHNSLVPHRGTNLLHLVGADIVGTDNKTS